MKSTTFDAIVIGGGFSGILTVKRLRDCGLTVKGIEKSSGLGGVWHSNRYPGVRTDTPEPFYQYFDQDLMDKWTWKERYATGQQMKEYFDFVDREWQISKDYEFNVSVSRAVFDPRFATWDVHLSSTHGMEKQVYRCRFLVGAVGFASRTVTPDLPGIDSFQGRIVHSSNWPKPDFSLENKRVAVIGTGASAAQIIPEIAPSVAKLTVYQRTPMIGVPKKKNPTDHTAPAAKNTEHTLYKDSVDHFTGIPQNFRPPPAAQCSCRRDDYLFRSFYEGDWDFIFGSFEDAWTDVRVNNEMYDFWAAQTRQKIVDPVKRELLVPSNSPFPIGVKRACLVDQYYETFNRENVSLVDVSRNSLSFTHSGIKYGEDNSPFDIVIFATGFESAGSSLSKLGIEGLDGIKLHDTWKPRTHSYLGMTIKNFPNFFYLYGPQAPAPKANVPTVSQLQINWICDLMRFLRMNCIDWVEPTEEAEREWQERVSGQWESTLYPLANTWQTGRVSGDDDPQWIDGIPSYGSIYRRRRMIFMMGFICGIR